MNRGLMTIAASVIAAGILAPSMAWADPPCGRGWRKHEWCGGYAYRAPRYVAPHVYYPRPPVVYAPPPVVYAPPPVMYGYPPPVLAPVPGISIGVNIPLR